MNMKTANKERLSGSVLSASRCYHDHSVISKYFTVVVAKQGLDLA